MAESEKQQQRRGAEKHELGIESEQQQQAFQSRTPDLETTKWMTEKLATIEAVSKTGKVQRALALVEASLAKLQDCPDVRLWESLLLSKKYLLLVHMGRTEEAHDAKEQRDRLCLTFEEWSKT